MARKKRTEAARRAELSRLARDANDLAHGLLAHRDQADMGILSLSILPLIGLVAEESQGYLASLGWVDCAALALFKGYSATVTKVRAHVKLFEDTDSGTPVRTFGVQLAEVASLPALFRAWLRFRRGKSTRPSVLAFEGNLEENLVNLANDLADGVYAPGGYRLRLIREPKPRLIAAAPVTDRVVHHALHGALAPHFDRSLTEHTYACLEGRGSHRAVLRFLRALRDHRHVLLLDIRRYFPSIDRGILLELFGRRLRDSRLLALLQRIGDSAEGMYRLPWVREALGFEEDFPPPGCGIPIGNLTSQWSANLYLSGLDHLLRREKHMAHTQRYMDDVAVFADDPRSLEELRESVAVWLESERHLTLKDPRAAVRSTREPFVYLGYHVDRDGIRPSAELLRRARKRLRSLPGTGDPERLARSMGSYEGMLSFGAATARAGLTAAPEPETSLALSTRD